ncbi:oxaloacetate decarboxylase [Hoeflea sp. TYP-13]|uniref:oxaloacetate decarboxylase n=1 Tax=Hoeflea sp. TYP-13 TaxID=3230023 RepID=UPI0034C5BE0A
MVANAKFEAFKALHERDGAFVIPNPWNAGSAIILQNLGFEALATTSAGLGFSIGRLDSGSELTREDTLQNAREIVDATDLPVSADLEGGFGDAPEDCAETIRQAAQTGLVGGSIEDATGRPDAPIYDFQQTVERVAAAVEAARDLPFLLTARAENFLYGRRDLDDTIMRLQAFEKAGADVLYAPGLPDLDAIRLVCSSISKPVNVVMGLSGPTWSVTQLADAGVKRISVGGSFARAALGGFIRAANEVREHGTFNYAVEALPDAEARRMMTAGRRQ